MAFNFDKLRGCFSTSEVIKPGDDSNFMRLLKATAERLAETKLFHRVFLANDITLEGQGPIYPYAAVFPEGLEEEEATNFENRKTFTGLILMETLDENPYRGVSRLLAIREQTEDALRTKKLVQLRDGDLHENTTLDTATLVLSERDGSNFVFSTGFRVMYLVTEPRRAE